MADGHPVRLVRLGGRCAARGRLRHHAPWRQRQTRPAGAPWRDPFRTLQDLCGYVSKHMPLPARAAGGGLAPDAQKLDERGALLSDR
jgi:hypothetical protein